MPAYYPRIMGLVIPPDSHLFSGWHLVNLDVPLVGPPDGQARVVGAERQHLGSHPNLEPGPWLSRFQVEDHHFPIQASERQSGARAGEPGGPVTVAPDDRE